MRVEQERMRKGTKNRLKGAVMGLALVSGALLSMGGAPAKHATSSIEAAKSASTPTIISPGEAIADRDVLDLQLD